MMEYKQDEYLQLSGLQHFIFCRRQWALIHIEQQWQENYHTVDGELFHERAHDVEFVQSRGDMLITRGVYLHSARLGVSGQCDVVEFHADPYGISLAKRERTWRPFPIEYKRGKPKDEDSDVLQLCAQAMCLEEMLCCEIPSGALFYGEIRRRVPVKFTAEMREQVEQALEEMHLLFRKGYTPKVKPRKGCSSCSLKELCMPKLMRSRNVHNYLRAQMEDDG